MSFIDYDGDRISATCAQRRDHDWMTVGGSNLVFEKPTWNKKKIKRYYFNGKITYCQRVGCHKEIFEGNRVAWKKTIVTLDTGEEVPLIEDGDESKTE